jgi:pilus assembly protein CpaB
MRFGGLIAAIVIAVIAAVVMLKMSGGNDGPKPGETAASQPTETTNIYVASQEIPVGTTIAPEMITVQPWPAHLVIGGENGFVLADGQTKVDGMIARANFQANEPILVSKLSNVNDPNFLAGSLPKGMRVLSIQTSEIEGVAGFIFPGDFVDVILTHPVKKWVTPPKSGTGAPTDPEQVEDAVTETLLTNVKVLAVDQRASGTTATDENGKLIIPRSVSLMVSPTDAQRLRLGAQKGTLTLALRALADRDSADPLTLTGNADISQYPDDASVSGRAGGGGAVLVIRGIDAKESDSVVAPPPADVQTQVPGVVTPAPDTTPQTQVTP